MVFQTEFSLESTKRGFHLITHLIEQHLPKIEGDGILHVFVKHTSAGLTINENADPSVRIDFEGFMNVLVPENHQVYTHTYEGADDMPAHLKTSLIGSSLTIPISNGRINMGTWQGIYLCEYRNYGGPRRIVLTLYS
ncbi:secondary thiamine-phosphate synthase enzyme YjbQ [Bacteroidota bacterium]